MSKLLFYGTSFLLERTINRKTIAIQTWVLVRHFLKKKKEKKIWSESVSSRKTAFAAKDEIQAIKLKLEILKTCICHEDLDSFATGKSPSDGTSCDSKK